MRPIYYAVYASCYIIVSIISEKAGFFTGLGRLLLPLLSAVSALMQQQKLNSFYQIVTICSQFLQKCYKQIHHVHKEDLFSRLPDEVIQSHVLPRLPVKDAVRTCILSRRWQKLWKHGIGPNLIFTRYCARCCIPKKKFNYDPESACRFANGIHHVLETYREPTLDELAICFGICSLDFNDVDSWVDYAFRKGVRRLELDLSPCTPTSFWENYAFPDIEKMSSLLALGSMHNLNELCLKYVDVSSEVVELMLSIFPFLETLCVWCSTSMKGSLRVSGKSLKLKRLELVHCYPEQIEISASSIMSLHYVGMESRLQLKHVPLLSELSIGGPYCSDLLCKGFQNFSYISQIKKLMLDLSHDDMWESVCYPIEFPTLVNLEHLEVIRCATHQSCLLWPIVLIRAAPILYRISFQLIDQSYWMKKPQPQELFQDNVRNLRDAIKLVRHQSLKVIEIHGFVDYLPVLKLCRQLLGIPQCLEQLVVGPFLLYNGMHAPKNERDLKSWQEYRKRAEKLAGWLPPGAKMVVL